MLELHKFYWLDICLTNPFHFIWNSLIFFHLNQDEHLTYSTCITLLLQKLLRCQIHFIPMLWRFWFRQWLIYPLMSFTASFWPSNTTPIFRFLISNIETFFSGIQYYSFVRARWYCPVLCPDWEILAGLLVYGVIL